MGNAIVALTRGYKELDKYSTLIQRNNAIYEFFGDKYENVLFHEGNISVKHQDYIRGKSKTQLTFIDISSVWKGGYEGMCRFMALDIFEFCKSYDYILRIDEDCILLSVDSDPFEQVGSNVYLYSVLWSESHSETLATLPQKVLELTGQTFENKHPYTNVGLAKVDFFLSEPIYGVLKEIATCPEQRANRWGDLPIHGALLQIFAKGRYDKMSGIKYEHLSHGFTIKTE